MHSQVMQLSMKASLTWWVCPLTLHDPVVAGASGACDGPSFRDPLLSRRRPVVPLSLLPFEPL
jgi:hypothetical protein